MAVTIEDVARRAGVSDATVSRVLSNKPHVRPEVRDRVLMAVADLGYRPSHVARSLRAMRSSIVGLIISDIQNPFFTALVRAVEDVANAHHHAVFLCNSDEDVDKEHFYIELMQREHVAGVLITPTRETGSHCRKLVEARIPVVVLDRRVSDVDVDAVVVDNVQGAFNVVSHLIEMGHRRIAAVMGSPAITTFRERTEGYVRALEAYGIPFRSELVGSDAPTEAAGCALTQQLLALSEPPTAIFAGNNMLTVGVLRAIRERKLNIPGDVALAAYDETPWASLMVPAITTVEQPTYELGQTAAELLLKRIKDNQGSRQKIVLSTKLNLRESSTRVLSV